jgi:hypothetical protein
MAKSKEIVEIEVVVPEVVAPETVEVETVEAEVVVPPTGNITRAFRS